MPIYEYECIHCRHRFEVKQSYTDKPEAECPECRETARRIFHPTPIIFKGSGFYVTDHRPGPAKESEKGQSEPSKSAK